MIGGGAYTHITMIDKAGEYDVVNDYVVDMHGGANIVVDGELECRGTFEYPVVIRGDRFDCINDVDQTPYDQHQISGVVFICKMLSHIMLSKIRICVA